MKGHQIAGMSATRERVEDDYYATPPQSTLALLEQEDILYPALEPACGAGHIARLLDGGEVVATDLVYRGYGVGGVDFLAEDYGQASSRFHTVITNPPFSLFTEFADKGLSVTRKKLIMFGKLQALEGQRRATFMEQSPLKKVWVFKKRQNPLRNGSEVDENGKPWASTMAFAWFVWEHGWSDEPMIGWL